MDGFYDGDLKDIWDSDLDPTESLKISTDSDLNDWFMERDMKDPAIMILNDKLMSDAMFNAPIKSEHSYSLNSDGDSLPDSPRSLQTKMDDMEDECYPAIPLKSATRSHVDIASVDPKCLAISVDCDVSPMELTSLVTNSSSTKPANTLLTTTTTTINNSSTAATRQNTTSVATLPLRTHAASLYAGLNKIASAPMTFNLRNPEQCAGSNGTTITLTKASASQQQQQQQQLQQHHQQQQQQQYLPQQYTEQSGCCSPSSTREGSTSPDICSDIEIDESCIKDEPMSPDSSCPSSPNSHAEFLSVSKISHLASRTNSDIVFEHKNGSLHLTPASQNLLKAQQLTLNTSVANSPNIIIPKYHVKTESTLSSGTFITTANGNGKQKNGYGLPLTPPSSSSSDDSEGNLSPEHLLSPLSPNTSVSISVANTASASTPALSVTTMRRSASSSSSSSPSSASSTTASCLNTGGRNVGNGNGGGTTRQPIHTPLISSQPKGSTGTLILTEEEKRTLQAEGYPIPQKLPLTKAEEKSLKKIRRKIKNKISAQESRRKKKEYMDQLERRVEILVNENNEQRKRVESLEHTNANLLSQLHKLQALLNKQNVKKN